MILGAIGEWIVGNTFPFVVFGTFGKLSSRIPQTNLEEAASLTTTLSSPSRLLLAHLRRHPRPIFQRIRSLRYRPHANGRPGWKPWKSAWDADTGVQR